MENYISWEEGDAMILSKWSWLWGSYLKTKKNKNRLTKQNLLSFAKVSIVSAT